MASLVVVVVKIVGDTGLRVGQVSENWPVAGFELLGFQACPQTLGLDVIVAFAASTVREPGLGLAQKGLVGIAYRLPAPVGMNDEAGALSQQWPWLKVWYGCYINPAIKLINSHKAQKRAFQGTGCLLPPGGC